MSMRVTFFDGAASNKPLPMDFADWSALTALLKKRGLVPAECTPSTCIGSKCRHKKRALAVCFGTFAPDTIRAKENVTAVTGIPLDIDHQPAGMIDAVLEWLHAWGVGFIVYATHNHLRGWPEKVDAKTGKVIPARAPEDDECFRIFIRASRDMTPDEWPRVRASLLAASGIPADPSVKDPSRMYFLPNWPQFAPRTWVDAADGPGADIDVLLAAAPTEVESPAPVADRHVKPANVVPAGTEVSAAAAAHLARAHAARPALGTYEAACILARDWDLDDEDALPILHAWSETWTDGQEAATDDHFLERLERARKYGTGGFGDARLREVLTQERLAEIESEETARATRLDRAMVDPDRVPDDVLNATRVDQHIDSATLLAILRKDGKGRIRPDGANVYMILKHLFWDQFRFDVLSKTVDASRSLFRGASPDTLPDEVANYLGFDQNLDLPGTPSASVVAAQLLAVARGRDFNPLTEYLNSLVWDGIRRIDRWLETYAAARVVDDDGADASAYVRMVGARWLIAAAARALHPGCKADTVLVLEGHQGLKKSTVFDILAGEWFGDTPLQIGQKDANLAAGSHWVIELAELASLRAAESEAQKAFLSSRVDSFRVPYGRTVQRFPRACVFCGTTNNNEYLIDRTGNRRFWCVYVSDRCDENALKRDRDQLWAEAVHRLREAKSPDLQRDATHEEHPQGGGGERWWLEPHEQVAADDVAARRVGDTLEDSFAESLEKWLLMVPRDKYDGGITASEAASSGLNIPAEKHTMYTLGCVGRALRALGWSPKGASRPRRYFPPAPSSSSTRTP